MGVGAVFGGYDGRRGPASLLSAARGERRLVKVAVELRVALVVVVVLLGLLCRVEEGRERKREKRGETERETPSARRKQRLSFSTTTTK